MAYKYLNDDGLKAYTKKVKGYISSLLPTKSVTYAELKALRDAGKLLAGRKYRITDFVTTTTQVDTRSAGHAFDIIVVADDESTLNENARAILHKGDTYFAGCKLGAWELKYCLDNDTTRFAWADATNGKGVVWWMKDEWDNECYYDFKNIQYKRYKVISVAQNFADSEYVGKYVGIYENIENAGLTTNSEFKWVYTFNLYTFATQGDPTSDIIAIEDSSVVQKDLDYDATDDKTQPNAYHYYRKCAGNKFGRLQNSMIIDDVQYNLDMLPNFSCLDYALNYDDNQVDLFTVHYCYGNRIDNGCFGISFGTEVCGVKVGKDCKTITCGNSCYSWTCGDYCSYWTCGNYCSYWTCGNGCYSWTCGDYCSYWTCRNGCHSWTCGKGCSYWTCGNGCESWTCGNGCSYWTCGNYCSYWTCGNDCHSWTCGNYCSYWTCGNYCHSWTCGNGCHSWTCGNEVQNTQIPQDCVSYFHLDSGVSYVTIKSSGTPTMNAPLKNFKVKAGIKGAFDNKLAIVIDATSFPLGSDYEWTIAKNSSGAVKQYCEADLIN